MRIPMGNFGNAVAQPQQAVQAPVDTSVSRALGNIGNTGMQIASDLLEAKRRTEGASTHAVLANDYYDIQDQIGRDVLSGAIKPEDASSTFRQRTADARKKAAEGLSTDQLAAIEPHLIALGGKLERGLQDIVVQRTQQDVGANLLNLGEQFQRGAMRDLPGAIDQWDKTVDAMGPQAGWNPVKMAEAKQKFREGATYNFANATLEGAAQTGQLDIVRAARQKIEGPEGEAIDPAKRTQLITKAYAYENGILAANARDAEKARREQDARENAAVDLYNKAFDLSSQGRYFSTEFINELSTAAAGTKMAGPVQELVKSQAKVAGFASLSLPQQQAEIERMRAAGSNPKEGVGPIEQNVQNQFTKIHEASVKAYQENPWAAAQERGVIKDAPVLSLSNVQDAQAVLSQRMKQIGQVEVAAGRKISPLQPQEAEQIGRLVRALPPDQQSSALASFGTLIGDSDRIADFAKQISEKDNVLGMAMMFANAKTTKGRFTSEVLLRGARAIKDKEVQIDAHQETGWRAQISNLIGDALPQTYDPDGKDARTQTINAAFYIMAGQKVSGESPDAARAVGMAVGKIAERSGARFPLPYGMDESEFDRRLKAIQPTDLASQAPGGVVYSGKTAIPLDQFIKTLPNAALAIERDGKYSVRAGVGLVTNAQGKRITIGVSNAH